MKTLEQCKKELSEFFETKDFDKFECDFICMNQFEQLEIFDKALMKVLENQDFNKITILNSLIICSKMDISIKNIIFELLEEIKKYETTLKNMLSVVDQKTREKLQNEIDEQKKLRKHQLEVVKHWR